MGINQVELWVLIFFFVLVSGMGFLAARWKRAESLNSLDEWGLGGRNFGTWVTWFLLGGDLYTAYTFIAVPALIYGVGATGFFAVPYTIIVYPMVFLVAPRLWSVSHRNGYVTPADFVRGRSGSGGLALAIAITGIVATMPYIALQLVGIEAVIGAIGINGQLAALHRLRRARRLHLLLRAAGSGADRVRQGRADLHRRHRGDHLHPAQARRLGQHLREVRREVRGHQDDRTTG